MITDNRGHFEKKFFRLLSFLFSQKSKLSTKMTRLWTLVFYSLLPMVKAIMDTKGDFGLSCDLDTFDFCFTSEDGNFTMPDGDVNIVAILSGDGKSQEKCIEDVLHSAINIEYAIGEAAILYPSRSNASIADYAIIHTCLCTNGSSLRADDILVLLRKIQNPFVILGANFFPPLFTYALLEIAESLDIPVYSVSSSHYVTDFQYKTRHSIVNYSAPSHEALIETVLEVIEHFGWSWVSFLTTDDEMGRIFMRTAEMKLETKDNVCIDTKILIKKPLTGDHFLDERLRIQAKIQNSTAKVFVAFIADSNTIGILDEIKTMFPGRVWILASLDSGHQQIAGDGWTLHISPTLYSLRESLDDFLIDWCSRRSNCSSRGHPWIHRRAGAICQGVENGTVEVSEVERVDLYMAVRMVENHATCASSRTPNSSCSSTSSFDHVMAQEVLPSTNESHSMNRFGGELGMNGRMSALPWGFDIRAGRIASSGHETNASDGGGVLIGRYIKNGLSSEMILIDDDLVIWPSGKGKIPESHCSGTCPSTHSRFSLPGQPSCCFVCLYCEGSVNFTSEGSMRCEKCPQRYWFNVTLGSCEPRYLDYLRWDSIPALVYIVVCSFSIVVNLIVLGVIAYHHASPIVKAANRELSLLLLLGTIVALVAPILHIGLPTVQHCMVHVGLQGPMITLIASVYLVKTKGVLSIFEAKLPDLMHSHLFLQRHLQVLAVFVLVLIEAVAAALYLMFAPPGVSYIDSHTPHITYVECNYGLLALPVQWLYNCVIVVLAFVLAYRARHLPENFGEARLIAKSMGFSLMMWFLSFTCYLLSSGSVKALFQNAILVASPWIFMGFLYFPKCYIILRQPHRNTAQELRRMTLAHVQRKAEQVCDSSASRRFGSQDVQKQIPSETSYKEKRDGQKMSSVNRGSSVKDGRIVLQIDAPEVSRQGTDETAISGSGSVSPSSDRSSRYSIDRDPAISSLNYTSTIPPNELENYIHGNGCSTPYLGNTNNSSSYSSDEVNDDEAHRTFTDDAENLEISLRLGVAESSASHPTSCTVVPDQPVVSTPSETPQENDGETDICAVVTTSSHEDSDTNDIVTEDRGISKGERCDKVVIDRIER